ncbi:MAG: hypothetical protein ACE5M4_05115, partial [Anaerolineales bacterium]
TVPPFKLASPLIILRTSKVSSLTFFPLVKDLETIVLRKGKAHLPKIFVQVFYKKLMGNLSEFR